MNIMTKRGSLDNIVTFEHICDTLADREHIDPRYVTLGSTCIVLQGESGGLEVYMASSDKEWLLVSDSSGGGGGGSGTVSFYICTTGEYDPETKIPTIEAPETGVFYLVPGGDSPDLFTEWVYVDEAWEQFGSATIDLTSYALKSELPTKVSDLVNDSNFAVDVNYVHTDNNYTTAEKNKLSSIAAGAEVNVNADWNATSGDAQILNKPTNVSSFINDSGYLTTETDPTVPAWAKAANKPSYTASEVGALPSNTHIPSTTAELTNDAGFITSAALETKAEIDGVYEDMTVGNAEQLVSTVFTEDQVPYKFRTSGGSADIGNRETDMIVGGTVVWNQLVDTATASVTVQSGHKLLTVINGAKSIINSTGTAIAVTGGTDMLFDLTAMFGSTIADYIYNLEQTTPGAGVTWFKRYFPKDYYEYNAGELLSVEGLQSHDMVGFNAYNPTTGTAAVLGGNQYQITGAYTALSLDGETITPVNGLFTPDHNGSLTVTGGGADTCVHLTWSGYRNGEYEPYEKHSYPLDSALTLRGIPKMDASGNLYYAGDTYESDGTVTRRYAQDEMTILSIYSNPNQPNYDFAVFRLSNAWASNDMFGLPVEGISTSFSTIDKTGIVTNYSTPSRQKCISIAKGTTLEQAKSLLDGFEIIYPIAEPTTETADPYQNPQIVDDFGTEEYVTDSIVPVGHVTRYHANLRAKLERLPDIAGADGDYIVQQSGSQMSLVPFTGGINTVTVSGANPVIVGVDNTLYRCGEVYTISITAPASGSIDVVFTSGSTVAVLTSSGITWPEWFDPTDLDTDTVYEINVADGRAVIATWPAA